jgi:hypothetical protein
VVLPDALPAPIALPAFAQDKIGGTTDVHERGDARIVYRLRRGRPGTAQPGDENAALRAGSIIVTRQGWRCAAPLESDLVQRWAAALADDAPLA